MPDGLDGVHELGEDFTEFLKAALVTPWSSFEAGLVKPLKATHSHHEFDSRSKYWSNKLVLSGTVQVKKGAFSGDLNSCVA